MGFKINSKLKNKLNLKNNFYKNIFILQKEWGRKLIKKSVLLSAVENKMPSFSLSKIEIHPAGECNFNCQFCYGALLAPKNRTNLPAQVVKTMLDDVKQNLSNENPLIILSGFYSEPFSNPEIKEIIQTIGDHNYRLGLYTNGVLIDKESIELIMNVAKNSKNELPSYVSFNVSGAIDNNCFEKQVKIITAFSKAKKKFKLGSDKFLINTPILVEDFSKKGIKNLEKNIKLLKKSGAENIRLSIPWEKLTLNLNNNNLRLQNDDFSKLKKIANKFKYVYLRENLPQGQYNKCYALARSIAISPEGLIFPCPETCTPLLSEKFSYGSILNEKLSNIWRGKKHNDLFGKLIPKNEHCKCCIINNKFNSFCSEVIE